MFEGAPDYPDKDIWWELIERYGVSLFYTAPTAIRAAMKWGKEYPEKHDLSSLRLLGTVGEPINPKAWLWYHTVIGGENCPIVDTWWQTETGHIMISPLPGLTETKPGSATKPLPGIDAAILEEESGDESGTDEGLLVVRRPWPGMLRTLYQDDERFIETYWDTFGKDTYTVGDAARQGRGRLLLDHRAHGRRAQRLRPPHVDGRDRGRDRVARQGRRGGRDRAVRRGLGPGRDRVRDARGRRRTRATRTSSRRSREHVGKKIGKLARPKRIIWADDLPKTRSGKIMRRLLRDIAEGNEPGDVSTLADPSVVETLEEKVKAEQNGDG